MGTEIERKFLLAFIPSHLLEDPVHICQGYILREKERTVRIRLAGSQGYVTLKGPTINLTRKEYEYTVPAVDARQMLDLFCTGGLIEKKRYKVAHKGHEWEIDIFGGVNQGLAVAEIELDSPDQEFEKPEWLGREVSNESRYYNASLISSPYTSW